MAMGLVYGYTVPLPDCNNALATYGGDSNDLTYKNIAHADHQWLQAGQLSSPAGCGSCAMLVNTYTANSSREKEHGFEK